MKNGVALDANSLVLSTRNSNALYIATLIQWLVPLLETYEHALQSGDGETRLEFADSIYQGISPDPELFLNHLDLPVGLCDTVFAPPPTCRSYTFATEMVSPVGAPILPFTEF